MNQEEFNEKMLASMLELVELNREISSSLKELMVQQEMIIQKIEKTNRRLEKI